MLKNVMRGSVGEVTVAFAAAYFSNVATANSISTTMKLPCVCANGLWH